MPDDFPSFEQGRRVGLPLAGIDPGYAFDPQAALAHLQQADPALAWLITRVGAFRLDMAHSPDTFGMLAKSIVSQQLSGKAAAMIFGRLAERCGSNPGWPAAPIVVAESDENLRAVGLSGAKVMAIRQLAEKACSGELPTLETLRSLDDEVVITHLSTLRGIGRWTAEMFLMFRLGRPDILPVDDLGVRKGFQRLYRLDALPSRQTLIDQARAWRPYRSVATWYLWRANELADLADRPGVE